MTMGPKASSGDGSTESDNSSSNWRTMNVSEKYRHVIKNITIEPILVCYIMPSVLAALATQNLNLEKACRSNLGYSDEVCVALAARETGNYTTEETEVQKLVANMAIWRSVLQNSVPALLILFVGSWSDRRGRRKPCILVPIVGEFLASVGLFVCAYYMVELPMEAAGICEGLFTGLTGGWMTMMVAIFSYIADVTTVKMRTFRIGIVNIFVSLGMPIGTALSGVLYQKIGFFGMFSMTSVLYVIGFIYGALSLKEVRKPIPREPGVSFLGDFFDLKHVVETFNVAFKARENGRRMRVLLLMVLSFVLVGPVFGEMNVTYLFTRYRFNWNEVDFSFFAAYCVAVNLVGTVISIGLFSKVWKMDDSLIGIVACVSKIASSFVYAFSTSGLMFYIAPLVDILSGAGFIAMRSMSSKLVASDELGKVSSLIGVCEAVSPLFYNPMYSFVYTRSLKTMPGSFYLLGSGLTVPALLIFIWMYVLQRRDVPDGEEDIDSDTLKTSSIEGSGLDLAYSNPAFEREKENYM